MAILFLRIFIWRAVIDIHVSIHKGHAGHAVVDGRLTQRCENQLMGPENLFNSCGICCSQLTRCDLGPPPELSVLMLLPIRLIVCDGQEGWVGRSHPLDNLDPDLLLHAGLVWPGSQGGSSGVLHVSRTAGNRLLPMGSSPCVVKLSTLAFVAARVVEKPPGSS